MSDKKERDLRFHVHNDVELLTAYPLAFTVGAEGFVMQEDRVVHIGTLKGIESYMRFHEGEFCQSIAGVASAKGIKQDEETESA